MKNGRLQAKDLTDADVIAAIEATRGRHGVSEWSTLSLLEAHLAPMPPRVVLAKLRAMIRRKVIGGCGCGCRGDFEVRS